MSLPTMDKKLEIIEQGTTITTDQIYPSAITTFDFGKGRMQLNLSVTSTDYTTTDEVYFLRVLETDSVGGSPGQVELLMHTIPGGLESADKYAREIPLNISKKYIQIVMDVGGSSPEIVLGAYMSPDPMLEVRTLR